MKTNSINEQWAKNNLEQAARLIEKNKIFEAILLILTALKIFKKETHPYYWVT